MDELQLQHDLLEDEEYYHEEELLHQVAVLGALIIAGADEARQRRNERRRAHRTYLVRGDLLPIPSIDTPWQVLYLAQNDRAFITTMGFDVQTFHYILEAGFATQWCTNPIPRGNVSPAAEPRINRRSLDPSGALGLVLHWLNSTMSEVSLMEIFALIPSTVSRYLRFSLDILLRVLQVMPERMLNVHRGL